MEDALKGTPKIEEEYTRDLLDELLSHSDEPETDKLDDDMAPDTSLINLFEVDERAESEAQDIINRLSGYYFNPKYIEEHPYIPNKIAQEMNNIRRLLKMLSVNEKAQDSIILTISTGRAKSTIYQALTSLQNTTLSIQSQLNTLTAGIENIFREMQEDADKTFGDKEKEELDDNTMVVRGSRDFMKELAERIKNKKSVVEDVENSIEETGEEKIAV